ncbi:hypothetical protein HMPREF9144_0503 [Prevotella pallens ATCC 700821]|uniref:Uncharacterized protein n=1 Tax=Prevotella pallens ATCC 700821 TaxID=997353 RepID=F9DFR3_9BACT|nr:hypothetical protein HMPREF9144_0503 [Prevotella pallens ATCC 700821]
MQKAIKSKYPLSALYHYCLLLAALWFAANNTMAYALFIVR